MLLTSHRMYVPRHTPTYTRFSIHTIDPYARLGRSQTNRGPPTASDSAPCFFQVLDIFWSLASNSNRRTDKTAQRFSVKHARRQTSRRSPRRSISRRSLIWRLPRPRRFYGTASRGWSKGLSSSSRDSAREGFSLALSGLIPVLVKQVGDVDGEGEDGAGDSAIMRLVRHMDQVFSKKDGQDVIGHLFGLGAIVSHGPAGGSGAGCQFSSEEVGGIGQRAGRAGEPKVVRKRCKCGSAGAAGVSDSYG